MKLNEKLLQQIENRCELIEKYYQKRIDKIYTILWNVSPILEGCSTQCNTKFTLEQLQNELQKNKNWFLSYLDFYNWDNKDIYEKSRTCNIMAAYLAYDSSLHPLERLHLAKHYCEKNNSWNNLLDRLVLTEIATQSYLQNSLYVSGKFSYLKK